MTPTQQKIAGIVFILFGAFIWYEAARGVLAHFSGETCLDASKRIPIPLDGIVVASCPHAGQSLRIERDGDGVLVRCTCKP